MVQIGSVMETNKTPEIVATFTNTEYGVESYVTISPETGHFHVTLKDTDANEILPMAKIFPDKERALFTAEQWANGGPVGSVPFFPFPA